MIVPLHLLTLDGRLDLLIPQVMIDEFERNRPRVEASLTSDVTQLFKPTAASSTAPAPGTTYR